MAYPTALHPATSYPGKICFNQIIRDLGHRIKYLKVAPETGEEVSDPRHRIGSYYAARPQGWTWSFPVNLRNRAERTPHEHGPKNPLFKLWLVERI
jgi:hypothetical protein